MGLVEVSLEMLTDWLFGGREKEGMGVGGGKRLSGGWATKSFR